MPFEFKTLDELAVADAIMMLLYGGAGTGKTWFCGTMGPRTLLINVGLGLATIQAPYFQKKYPSVAQMLIANITPDINEDGSIAEGKAWDMVASVIDEAIKFHSDKFDSVVIDDASALRRAAMVRGIEINQAESLSQTKSKLDKYDTLMPAMQDYQREMSMLEQFVAYYTVRLKGINKNFVITGHERLTFKKGDRMGDAPVLIKISPWFTGVDKSPDQITQYFDNVWRTEAVSGGSQRIYRITTQGSESTACKTRWSGVFDTVEKDLDWPNAVRRIKETKSTGTLKGIPR